MDLIKAIKEAKKHNVYCPRELENEFSDIYIKYSNGIYLIVFNEKEKRFYDDISMKVDGNDSFVENHFINSFEKVNKSSTSIIIGEKLFLFLEDGYLKIIFKYNDNNLVLKKYKIDSNTYFEYDSNLSLIMFGNKVDYFHNFEVKLGDSYLNKKLMNFYQEFKEKSFFAKKEKNVL